MPYWCWAIFLGVIFLSINTIYGMFCGLTSYWLHGAQLEQSQLDLPPKGELRQE